MTGYRRRDLGLGCRRALNRPWATSYRALGGGKGGGVYLDICNKELM